MAFGHFLALDQTAVHTLLLPCQDFARKAAPMPLLSSAPRSRVGHYPLLLSSCACRPDSRVQQGKSEARFKLFFLYSSFVMFISLPHSGPVLEIVSFLIASDLETGPRSTLAGLRPHGYQADVLVCLGPSMGRQHISLFLFRFCLSRVFVSLRCQMRR